MYSRRTFMILPDWLSPRSRRGGGRSISGVRRFWPAPLELKSRISIPFFDDVVKLFQEPALSLDRAATGHGCARNVSLKVRLLPLCKGTGHVIVPRQNLIVRRGSPQPRGSRSVVKVNWNTGCTLALSNTCQAVLLWATGAKPFASVVCLKDAYLTRWCAIAGNYQNASKRLILVNCCRPLSVLSLRLNRFRNV